MTNKFFISFFSIRLQFQCIVVIVVNHKRVISLSQFFFQVSFVFEYTNTHTQINIHSLQLKWMLMPVWHEQFAFNLNSSENKVEKNL